MREKYDRLNADSIRRGMTSASSSTRSLMESASIDSIDRSTATRSTTTRGVGGRPTASSLVAERLAERLRRRQREEDPPGDGGVGARSPAEPHPSLSSTPSAARSLSPSASTDDVDAAASVVRNVADQNALPPLLAIAMSDLDRAEDLVQSGRELGRAMELYEGAIGILIGYLKSTKSKGDVDRASLAERIRAALSEAEGLKKTMSLSKSSAAPIAAARVESRGNHRDKGDNMPSLGGKRSPAVSPTSSSVSAAMSSYLKLGVGGKGIKIPPWRRGTRGGANTDADHCKHDDEIGRRNNQLYAASLPSHNERGTVSPSKAAATAAAVIPAASNPASPPNQRKQRSNLDYAANDPLVLIVKRDLYVDSSNLRTEWNDIVGLEPAKRAMQEAAILPMVRPDLYTGLRSPPRGVLLYGPPGTGKTMLVRAAAKESMCILFACTASALTSKWHGEGEKLLKTLFAVAADAAPSALFFDEIDALLSSRSKGGGGGEHEASRRFKTEFMVQMDGIVGGMKTEGGSKSGGGGGGDADDDVSRRVLVLGCTNCPWDVDDAVMRRFQRRIYVPLPDTDARRHLMKSLLAKEDKARETATSVSASAQARKKSRPALSSLQMEKIVERTEGFSCSDISALAHEAAFGPLREMGGIAAIRDCLADEVRPMEYRDFKDALVHAKKSVSIALIKRYKAWEEEQRAVVA